MFASFLGLITYFLQEITDTFRDSLVSDEVNHNLDVYLIHMCRELLRFVNKNERLVKNIRTSSMFSVLMGIMLDEISSDIYRFLSHSHQGALKESEIEGTASFYAGGMINTLYQHLRRYNQIDETEFIGMITPHFKL
ncbi:hypothetical protein TP70_09400 [Staphylococcus microti]|uniref:Uncharacterized protein n=1 Tax=Staphylococcus microti TaxID=569857 RepID=A0A0D6XQH2_9STAP|nr:hypothetical protein TP70_09400 [Staphylococcus microti]SUM57755.1 Uncharacterised protein [Staphylococcus microti]